MKYKPSLKEIIVAFVFLTGMLIPCWAAAWWQIMQGNYGLAAVVLLSGIVIMGVILWNGM